MSSLKRWGIGGMGSMDREEGKGASRNIDMDALKSNQEADLDCHSLKLP